MSQFCDLTLKKKKMMSRIDVSLLSALSPVTLGELIKKQPLSTGHPNSSDSVSTYESA